MATTWNAIYLGSFGTQIDPTENNTTAENASVLVNQTFGNTASPLYTSIFSVTAVDNGGTPDPQTGGPALNQNNNSSNDFLRTDLNRDGTAENYTFDAVTTYVSTITFSDGTTATATLAVAQTTDGKLFLLPSRNSTTNATLQSKPITAITLNSISPTGGTTGANGATWGGAVIDRQAGVFKTPDGLIEGTSGADSIGAAYTADPEGDRIDNLDNTGTIGGVARSNDDVVQGFAGNDTIASGLGNDTVYAGTGNDSVNAGAGNDVIYGYGDTVGGSLAETGDDTLLGGDGNDSLYGGAGRDSLDGGTGIDLIDGGADSDTIIGGDAGDSLIGGAGNDTIYGDDTAGTSASGGADTIDAGDGGDRVVAGVGNDSVTGGLGADTILGGAGADFLAGDDSAGSNTGGAADVLDGGAGTDTLVGGYGNDQLDGGADSDTLVGGQGFDTFTAGTGDVIRDFNTGTGQNISDGITTNNDLVDLSNLYSQANLDIWNANNPDEQYFTPLGWLRADQSDGVLSMLNGANGLPNFTMTIQTGGTATAAGNAVAPGDLTYDNTMVACFTLDTLIETVLGPTPVQDLVPGDLVLTSDNGMQPVRWVGRRTVSTAELQTNPSLRPVRIAAGALGNGTPTADLIVSPQHRILIRSIIAQKMFDAQEVLVAAKHLTEVEGIDILEDVDSVTYVHFMFDTHQVVFSNGAETESLYAGDQALSALTTAAREEIYALFPDLKAGVASAEGARPFAPGRKARNLARRHAQADKALVM